MTLITLLLGSVCIYQNTRWTKCNKLTNTRSKIVTLDPSSPKNCNTTVTFTRMCQNKKAGNKGKKQRRKRGDILPPYRPIISF